jgi:ABC-type multidrug transport system fused ATPase/permease subunit
MVADRVLVLENGKLIQDGLPTDLLAGGQPLASQIAEITQEPGLITIEQVIS